MRTNWEDKDISKIFKDLAETGREGAWPERAWMHIENRLTESPKDFREHRVWRPWGHPIRWVVAACFLFVAFTGVYYQHDQTVTVEKTELASYLVCGLNPMENITRDQNGAKVSALLSEPSSAVPEFSDDFHSETLAGDEIFL